MNPQNAPASGSGSEAQLELQWHEAALVRCDQAIARNPDDAEAHKNRGNALFALKRHDAAIQSYDRALRLKPDYADAHYNRGNVLNDLGRHDAAAQSFDRAIALNPGDAEAYNNRGIALQALERHDAAIQSFEQAVALHPGYADAFNNRGNVLKELGRYDEALASYDRALAIRPDYAEVFCNRGAALQELQRYDEALACYDQALAIAPDDAEALINRGAALQHLKRFDEALQSYERALSITPDIAEVLSNRGLILQQLERYDAALASYDRALALKPDYAEALINRGVALQGLKRHGEALACYDRALALRPDYPEALINRGAALQHLKRYDEALACYDRALALKPELAGAVNNRGNTLKALKRYDEALASYDRALAIRPDYAEALINRGAVLQDLKRYDEALACHDRALGIRPDYAEALVNRGAVLQDLKRYDEALASYDRALAIKPDCAEAPFHRGNALQELMRYDGALASYDRALAIRPDYTEALINRGAVLEGLKRLDEAVESYARALVTNPEYEFLYGTWLHAKMSIGNWRDAESQFARLASRIQLKHKATPPFPALACSLPLQRIAAETWVESKHRTSLALPAIPRRARHEKIRIGYYSADYHNHATAYLMAGLFEQHQRARFELVAFSFGPNENDAMRKRVSAAFDRFIDVRNVSDRDIALLSRELGIDIAVDLKGFTQDERADIFAYRAAPLQVNYLGYPGTMGAEYIDYLIADSTLIPESSRQHYSEKIAYLPNSYQANDRKRAIANTAASREESGLPATGFVFCCFNNSYKINPATFDGWMRILRQVPASVLWLFEANPSQARNLRREAEARGIDAARLIFAKHTPPPEHLARIRLAGLFLDTLPYNAHTTASDALWAGLPVLTYTGETFVSRVAASLLKAIELPELITTTQQQYEALAVELASDPERLGQIKQKLEKNRLTTPLFDTELFTRHIEAAYTQMYERYQAGLPPEDFHVGQ